MSFIDISSRSLCFIAAPEKVSRPSFFNFFNAIGVLAGQWSEHTQFIKVEGHPPAYVPLLRAIIDPLFFSIFL